jgi:hypothetical protein
MSQACINCPIPEGDGEVALPKSHAEWKKTGSPEQNPGTVTSRGMDAGEEEQKLQFPIACAQRGPGILDNAHLVWDGDPVFY